MSVVAATMMLAMGLPFTASGEALILNPPPETIPDPCPKNDIPLRIYDITALKVPIIYNNWGDFDPLGMMLIETVKREEMIHDVTSSLANVTSDGELVLANVVDSLQDAASALAAADADAAMAALNGVGDDFLQDQVALDPDAPLTGFARPVELQQPLVIRARLGECVQVVLHNLMDAPVGLHIHGLTAKPGAGGVIGTSTADITLPGATGSYTVYVPEVAGMEGAHIIHSHADSRYQTRHGLFGALAVEEYRTSWTDQEGVASASGQAAIIDHPKADFREYVLLYHDEVALFSMVNDGATQALQPMPVIDKYNNYQPGSKAINYRSEPFTHRFAIDELENGKFEKSLAYSSYTYGDPGVFIPRSYVGDPTKFRLANVGPGQHHVHHLHGGGIRWRASPEAENSQFDIGLQKDTDEGTVLQSASERLDVQNIGPGEAFSAEIEGGAGGVQQSAGDFLYHCHIVEHYVAGMWSFWRVHNTWQADLAPLPDRADRAPPAALTSAELWGKTIEGVTLDENTFNSWIESKLPSQGAAAIDDASSWDWSYDAANKTYYGEPNDDTVWANYDSTAPGDRPPIMFNATNGRPEWPLFAPHLGKRPPFAPEHGPSPYLGKYVTADRPDGLCLRDDAASQRNYQIVAQKAPLDYNDHDTLPDGMVFAHAEEAREIALGNVNPTSLVLRANQGECVNVLLTNNLTETDTTSKANMHIHLVQFDVQASDGVITGYAYEQSVRPVIPTSTTLTAIDTNAKTLTVEDGSKIRENTWIGIGLLTEEVSVVLAKTKVGNVITYEGDVTYTHAVGQYVGPEFVRYQWYPDVELGVIYWHDHADGVKSWQRGLFGSLIVEPAGSRWCDPHREVTVNDVETLSNCTSVQAGHVVDIVPPDSSKAFREIVLQYADRACASTMAGCSAGQGNPLFPRAEREVAAFNMRAEPLRHRNADLPFASWAADPDGSGPQGDPHTTLLRAYPGDDVRIRLVFTGQSMTTGVATFTTPGHRFALEDNLEGSRVMDTLSFGISSQHNLRLDCGAGGCEKRPGDYLYGISSPDMLDRGAWGVFRVHDANATDLARLPSNIDWSYNADLTETFNRSVDRTFRVRAVTDDVTMNERFGMTVPLSYFVHEWRKDEVMSGDNATPLVLRAKAGEVISVTLTNERTKPVSLFLPMVAAHANSSYGIPVGTNQDNRVQPGETKTLYYYLDKEVGAGRITSFGGISSGINDAMDGLYGALVVEPALAQFDNDTRESEDIHMPDGSKWREHVLQYGSDDAQFFSSTMQYFMEVRTHGVDMPPNVNYRTDPLHARVGGQRTDLPSPAHWTGGMGIHSCQIESAQCGLVNVDVRNPLASTAYALLDPETPVIDVQLESALLVRSVGGAGDQLAVQSLDGHWWAQDWDMAGCNENLSYLWDCKSNIVSSATLGPGEASNAWIPAEYVGTGGEGDYLWGNHRDPFREAGQWGILRVCGPKLGNIVPGTLGCLMDEVSQVSIDDATATIDRFREVVDMAVANITAFADTLREGIPPPQNVTCTVVGAGGISDVKMPPAAFAANISGIGNPGFVPTCTLLTNSGSVVFEHLDVPIVPHDPASTLDADDDSLNRCFRALDHRTGEMTSSDHDFTVMFRWDPVLQKVFAKPGSQLERDCTDAVDVGQSTASQKVIPYRCDRHHNMVGTIVVEVA